jgi:hypothetical protein
MFGETERGLSFGAWVLQLVLAYCGPVLGLGLVERSVRWTDTPATTLLEYVIIAALSGLLSLAVLLVAPDSSREGCWIWALPAIIGAVVLIVLCSRGFAQMLTLFYAPPGEGEAGWAIVLLTLPTWSCCCYSAAMWGWRRRHEKKGLE